MSPRSLIPNSSMNVSFCPNCLRPFNPRGLQTHLNHQHSSCFGYQDDYDKLRAFSEEEIRRCEQHALERAQEHALERVPTFQNLVPSPPLPPPPISTVPPHINTTIAEYHPRSSYIYGNKKNTFARITDDGFAHRRVNNPYYPFQGHEEWELACFLARSSLSQLEIDEFLKLKLVTPVHSSL